MARLMWSMPIAANRAHLFGARGGRLSACGQWLMETEGWNNYDPHTADDLLPCKRCLRVWDRANT